MKSSSSLPLFVLLLLLSFPDAALTSEGPAWIYFVMAPFALFTIPFFFTAVCVAFAVYCYWRYRTTKKKSRGVIAVLVLLLAIPAAVRDKQVYVIAKIEREHREQVQLKAKQRREARRAGKHVSPDFTAISTAYTAKYMASAKTETDRLNFQASREMLQMQRAIDAMQQKEPPPVLLDDDRDKPPVRSGKAFLFELYAGVLLAVTALAGAAADRWRRSRNWAPLMHLAPLLAWIYAPVFAQLPFMDTLMGMNGPRVYLSWFALLAFTPLSYFAAYGAGILLWSLRSARMKGTQAEQPHPNESLQETTGPVVSSGQPPADGKTFFACPECRLEGKIADARLPEQGLMATCPRCKTRFPVRRAVPDMPSETDVMPAAAVYAAVAEASTGDEVPEAVTPRKKFTFTWRKVLVGMSALLVLDWLVQTMLLNALIVLGSNAGAKFTLLAPQALLPCTLPTRVSFIDKTSNKPLAGKQVRVTWEYHPMGILPETEARYADRVYTTDANGKIWLPCRLKPPKTYLMAFYHSFNQGVFLYLNDPGYIPAGDRPYLPPRITGEHLTETIVFMPCRTPQDWDHALSRAIMFPYSYLKEGVDGVVRNVPLDSIPDQQLQHLSECCDALVTPASQKIDAEVVRRGPQRMYTESYIRTLIRLGREQDAIAALPLLADRPHAEEWQKYFRKFVDDLAFEQEMAKESPQLISSGKSGAQLHEEALALHKQKKYRESLPLYHAAITLSPESGRYVGNYACAVYAGHGFFGEKLARRAIPLDRNRGHSYLMLADGLFYSNRREFWGQHTQFVAVLKWPQEIQSKIGMNLEIYTTK